MPLRIVPSEATDAILLAVDRPVYIAEPRAMYREFVEARPNLTREQVDDLTEIFNVGKRHWMKTDQGKHRFNLPKDCLLRMNDRADMLRFLAAAFEQKCEG